MTVFKHTSLASLAVAGMLAFGASSANAFLFDGFGDVQVKSEDYVDGGTGTTGGLVAVTDTDLSNNQRQLTANCLVGCNSTPGLEEGVEIFVNSGLLHFNSATTSGTGLVEWFFDATDITGLLGGNIQVNIFDNDNGGDLDLTLIDTAAKTATLSWSFAPLFTGLQNVSLAGLVIEAGFDTTMVNEGSLLLTGNSKLDVEIDFIQQVSEPAALGLFGLGLIGLGIATRRRKTA